MPLILQISEPGHEPRSIEVPNAPFTIGRDDNADLTVSDSKVSRLHLRVEPATNHVECIDLDSANGFRLHGSKTRRATIKPGNAIRIGDTQLELIDPSAPPPLPPADSETPERAAARKRSRAVTPEAVLDGSGRRRALNRVVVPILVIAVIGCAAFWVVDSSRRAAEDDPLPSVTEARELLAKYEQKLYASDSVNEALWSEGRNLIALTRDVAFPATNNPVPEVSMQLKKRRELYFNSRASAFVSANAEAFDAHQYGVVLAELAEFRRATGLLNDDERDWYRAFSDNTESQLAQRLDTYRRRLALYEETNDSDELRSFLTAAQREFAGTDHLAHIDARLAKLNDDNTDVVTIVDQPPEAAPESVTSEAPRDILALLQRDLSAGTFAGKRYTFDGFRAAVLNHDADGVTIESKGERRRIAVPELPRITQLQFALSLRDEQLLTAARAGYAWNLEPAADALLERYFRGDRAARKGRVDQLLADVRGHDMVPTGGFVYSKEFGWEEQATLRHREMLAELAKETDFLVTRTRHDTFVQKFDAAMTMANDSTLPADSRLAAREVIVNALVSCRNEILGQLDNSLEAPFGRMRKAKIELDVRRKTAIAVIMDPKIYLPENHPDWRKGDHRNGQKEVDAEVDKVRELWAAESYDFTIPKKITRSMARLNFIEGPAATRLEHTFSEETTPMVAELRNNPGPLVSLKTYATTADEAKLRTFNDKVRAYNAAFQHEDVPDADRRHVIYMSDYREMMGCQRCFIDVRLCRATRKHSEVCDKAGTIWHNGPDGTPGSRAAAEGFEAGVGENVALGYANPKGIWDQGWYRASDHHRNAIGPGWNCLGYGYHGRVGTQNFANIPPPWAQRS